MCVYRRIRQTDRQNDENVCVFMFRKGMVRFTQIRLKASSRKANQEEDRTHSCLEPGSCGVKGWVLHSQGTCSWSLILGGSISKKSTCPLLSLPVSW